jgi:hypothetical protein
MTRLAPILALLLVLFPSLASAQEPPAIKSGARVRVWTAPTVEPITGKVLSLTATTMTLAIEGVVSPAVVERRTITRVDVDHRRSRGRAALYGALLGAAAGVMLGLASGDDPKGIVAFSAPQKAVIGVAYIAPAGALIGVLVGPGPERWTTVLASPGSGNALAALPAPSLRFSFRF